MIDYAFLFVDEATAKTALPNFWIDNGDGTWGWDASRIMATRDSTSAASFYGYMGIDRWDGYFVSLSVTAVSDALYAIPQCIVEADRDSATFLRTRLDNEQTQALDIEPVMAGTAYLFAGRGHSFILDNSQHPIGDDGGLILGSSPNG